MNASRLRSTQAALVRAIRGRRVVVARYAASDDSAVRVFYPHLLYQTAAGELVVDVFQVDGPSRGGRLPGWRVLKAAGLRDVEILDTVFLPVPRRDVLSAGYRREILAQCGELRGGELRGGDPE